MEDFGSNFGELLFGYLIPFPEEFFAVTGLCIYGSD
jgi:hypothetical protein